MKTGPEAFFDAVTIIRRVGPELGGASRFEIQRIAYLACLLGLYDGKPLAIWGYQFIRSEFGAPFSADLNGALERLYTSGLATLSSGGRFVVGDDAFLRSKPLLSDRLKPRERWLMPACDSALFLPASTLAAGIDGEPTSASAALQDGNPPLLSNSAQSLLYDQIHALRKVAGVVPDDLLTPSMVWMTYSAKLPSLQAIEASEK
ncbi:hypothetical protein ACFOMD_17265 [Sphingoaurantiacus capsulatus]|uniref:DUF4065 domain-containing protein n=1 Tax=Sphingoaurantiacus capsulatus TaxID=1771310 RepID=A0ABV7XH86_9SPHN